ncbi:MAG: alpha/beta hydrolase, partial [Christensenellaceae bacterium]|nr:alpha/beta hydrolase [Christensenellaceae bacterium]
ALDDCYFTLEWIVKNAKELKINQNQIFVGGESAGGGLVAALSLYARDKGDINIAFQMPLYPMLDNKTIYSHLKNSDAPLWDYKTNKVAWDIYLEDVKDNVPIYAVPSLVDNLTNIPPTCTFVGELDLFYNEVVEYVNKLKNSNVPVFFETYKSSYHAFEKRIPNAEVSKKAKKHVVDCFNYACKNYFAENNKC